MATEVSEQVATRFVTAIEAHFEPLRHFPLSGPACEQLASGLRVTFHSPYAIYYLPLPDRGPADGSASLVLADTTTPGRTRLASVTKRVDRALILDSKCAPRRK